MKTRISARRPEPVEDTTVIFVQPEDEVPRVREPEPESIVGKTIQIFLKSGAD